MTPKVIFDHKKRELLRAAHAKAKADGVEQFNFDGQDYITRFAGYLLEYLDMKLPPINITDGKIHRVV